MVGLRKVTTTKKTERKCEIYVLDSKGWLNNSSVEWPLTLLLALFFREQSSVLYMHRQCGVYMYTHCGMCGMSYTVGCIYIQCGIYMCTQCGCVYHSVGCICAHSGVYVCTQGGVYM